jgi:hypothetical protein
MIIWKGRHCQFLTGGILRRLSTSGILAIGVKTALTLVMAVLLYALWWAIWYRLPAQPDQVVDLRTLPSQGACYITFCAGLADNPLGFPGHAYVVWGKRSRSDQLQSESVGFITRCYNDQFISPLVPVPGMLHYNAALHNQRNLESLTVIVSPQTYQATLLAREKWNTKEFRAIERDCLSFTTYIAHTAGLVIPEHRCLYPQDQLKELKACNKSRLYTR